MVRGYTYEEFIKKETEDWGFDWVETQFANGFDAVSIDGYWQWIPVIGNTPVDRNTSTIPYTPVNLVVRFRV